MKKILQFAIAVMLLFSACSKEELTPPSVQPQSTFDVRCAEEEPEYDSHISLDEARQDMVCWYGLKQNALIRYMMNRSLSTVEYF